MKKKLRYITFTTVCLSLALVFSLAAVDMVAAQTQTPSGAPPLDYSGFVKCDGVVKKGEASRNVVCDFAALITTAIKAIQWLFYITMPLVAALLAYGGYLYMTGTPNNLGLAKKIFTAVGIGFIIMITAWVAVSQFVSWFVKPDSGATTFIDIKK
jgi:hypothetical protein